jgi:hypothetical protein
MDAELFFGTLAALVQCFAFFLSAIPTYIMAGLPLRWYQEV